MPKRPKKFQAFKPHRCRRAKAQTLRTIVNRQIQKPSLETPNLKPLKANACVFHLGAVSWQTFDFIARHGAQGLLYIYIFIFIYLLIYLYLYLYLYLYTYMYMYTHTYIHIIYIYTHTHMHTNRITYLPTYLPPCVPVLTYYYFHLTTYLHTVHT